MNWGQLSAGDEFDPLSRVANLERKHLLIIAPVAFVTLMLLVPISYLAIISLRAYDPNVIHGTGFTVQNYSKLIVDPFYREYILYTLKIATVVTAICLLLGYPVGFYLGRTSARKRAILMFLVVLPLMAGLVIRTFGWLRIFGADGILNQIWKVFFNSQLQILGTTKAVIIGLVGVYLPFVVMPVYSSVESIDRSLEFAARNLGASKVQAFYRITLPLSIPGIVLGSIFAFTLSMSSVITPKLLGGRNDVTIGALIYDVALANSNWPFASAMAVTVVVINFLLIFGYLHISRGEMEAEQ